MRTTENTRRLRPLKDDGSRRPEAKRLAQQRRQQRNLKSRNYR